MPRALIIERSATLRKSLERRLLERAFETEPMARPTQALEHLQTTRTPPDLVVLGWPEHPPEGLDPLLAWLADTDTPVLLICEQIDSQRSRWVAGRPNASLLTWNQIERLHDVLDASTSADSPFGLETDDREDDSLTILLVDDSRTVRTSYSKLLKEHGYHVIVADNVESGFAMACEQAIDIAIIDYFMPEATGDELCRRLGNDPRTASTLRSILTGSYRDNIIQAGLQAGAIEVMFKNEAQALFLARVDAMRRNVVQRRGLHKRQRHLEGILNAVGDGVYGVDNDGRLTFMNPTARRLLALEGCQLQGNRPHALFHYASADGTAVDEETCFLTAAYTTGESIRQWETVFWSRKGECLPVEGTILPLRIGDRRHGSVVAFRDVSEHLSLQQELLHQATHDTLTGLYNRGHFEDQLNQEIQRVQRTGDCSALVFVDLDRFKYINDTAGHAAGDQLLQEVAKLLQSRLRGSDSLGRIGGDEFAILLRNVKPEQLEHAADAFRQLLVDFDFNHAGKSYNIAGSIGVTRLDTEHDSMEEAMARADHAARIAKEMGRNQTHLFQPSDDRRQLIHQELGWSQRLTQALQQQRFLLLRQPVKWVNNQHSVPSEEMLLRLQEQQRLTRPNAFLSAAERFGLMERIDHWVLQSVIAELGKNQHPEAPVLWVNLAASTLAEPKLAESILHWLAQHQVQGSRLGLEISEATAHRELESLLRLAEAVRPHGVQIGLDDFGGGLGSFTRLRQMPVDQLKMDPEIIHSVHRDNISQEILTATVRVARALGIITIGKCIETHEQAEMARNCGVDGLQGNYIQEPSQTTPGKNPPLQANGTEDC